MLRSLIVFLLLGCLADAPSVRAAGVRLKDLVMIAGAQDNQLVGIGLVTGLAGDGDKDPVYTVQVVANMLQRQGITVTPATITSKNVAVVTVTAKIPPFAKPGTPIDVTVASMGDAKSLNGAILLQTPLLGVDEKAYALAQGPISVGGFSAGSTGGGGANVQKNHPTVGQIINGASVLKEIPSTIVRNDSLELLLREPDFTSASLVSAAINERFSGSAQAVDKSTIRATVAARS